jgi:hypothetical protein
MRPLAVGWMRRTLNSSNPHKRKTGGPLLFPPVEAVRVALHLPVRNQAELAMDSACDALSFVGALGGEGGAREEREDGGEEREARVARGGPSRPGSFYAVQSISRVRIDRSSTSTQRLAGITSSAFRAGAPFGSLSSSKPKPV